LAKEILKNIEEAKKNSYEFTYSTMETNSTFHSYNCN